MAPTTSLIALFTLFATSMASPLSPVSSSSRSKKAPLLIPEAPPSPAFSSSSLNGEISLFANVRNASESHLIPNNYIVKLSSDQHKYFDDHLSLAQALHQSDSHLRASNQITFGVEEEFAGLIRPYKIGKKFLGYHGHFSPETIEAIRSLDGVEFVEMDSRVHTLEEQKFVPWGLHRISHRKPIGFQTLIYNYEEPAGDGVDVYVIDTGVNIEHVEFEGRAEWGKTIPLNDADKDANGHGSHVAGTIGSRRYGVAKKASIYAVKVLGSNGSGSMSDVIGGIEYATEQTIENSKKKGYKGSVANMSLGGGKVQSLDDACDAAVEEGLMMVVAAGNDNRDACKFSPAASAKAITVGASTIGDERAYFSNWGTCVDVFAPGLNILSTWNTGPNSINTISGTSMASPHVAGLAAYFISLYPKSFSPATQDFEDSVYENLFSPQSSTLFSWVKDLTGSFLGETVAKALGFSTSVPIPNLPSTIPPEVLKKALIRLSSSGVLADVGKGSPNLLVFNNFTYSA